MGVVFQVMLALSYYVALVVMMRVAGKRLSGQTTTLDLVVLITLAVVLQRLALRPGPLDALVFVVTVFAVHRGLSRWCVRSSRVRHLVRGAPRPLVRDGHVSLQALEEEGLSYDDLLAGLRKSGHGDLRSIRFAVLEETGHISAIPVQDVRGRGTPAGTFQ